MEAKIRKIIEGWFIYENALFEICLTHALRENQSMSCPMRCGNGRIEYNPRLLSLLSDQVIESLLKIECVRIILKHPYERQPIGCTPITCFVASSIVIGDNYALNGVTMAKPADFGLPSDMSYEWYAYHLPDGNDVDSLITVLSDASAADIASDYTALWQEDTFMVQYLNQVIAKIEQTKNWGSMPGDMVQTILADMHVKIDYRKILAGFRMSVLSSKRRLTRMRPNRRTGFDNMGSVRTLNTKLLVAVDVSSSVSDESLNVFFSVVNQAFRYGIETLDLVTFDTKIHDVMEYSRGKSKVTITGRGGTCFQPAIDYAHEHKYDGLLIFTDGEAPVPELPSNPRFKVVWVFDTLEHYDQHHDRLSEVGRCCPIQY